MFNIIPKMYAQCNIKRQKVTRETRAAETNENFPGKNITRFLYKFNYPFTVKGLGKIEYKPDNLQAADDVINFRYYNATERIHGRSMEDWLRTSVYIGQAFSPKDSYPKRPWNERMQTVENYKKGIRAAFELCIKLGKIYWCRGKKRSNFIYFCV